MEPNTGLGYSTWRRIHSSVLLETVASAERAADAIVHALDIIFGGYPVGRPH